jgi:hypothetical protein
MRRRLLRKPERRRLGGLRGVLPHVQCWRCEKPFGCLQSILRLYLSDHLCGRFWVLRVLDLFGIYIYTKEKKVGCGFIATPQGTPSPVNPLAYGIKG